MSAEEKRQELNDEAWEKLSGLLTCGNERVELAAAKELISILDKDTQDSDKDVNLEVTIKIV